MDRKYTFLIALITTISLGVLLYVGFRQVTLKPKESEAVLTPMSPTVETIITAKHAYKNGEHVLVGEIVLPTPCHLLEQTTTITPDNARATIAFVRMFKGGSCPGGEISGNFKVIIPSPATTTFQATLDGRAVRLNLVEVSAEDVEKVDIYLKG